MLVDEIMKQGLIKCGVCGSSLVKDKFAEDEYGPHWLLRCPNFYKHPGITYIPTKVKG